MDKSNMIVYTILGVALIIAVYTLLTFVKSGDEPALGSDYFSNKFKSITTGGTENGDISVELTPKGVNNGILEVAISINTHSAELSQFDLKQIATLEYNGKSIKPSSAPQLSGHHASGDLLFKVNDDIEKFVITIIGMPKTEKRVFEWR
ncbi:hypothetical protein HYY70_04520 [Candidatus Woesearchaeota archaeon]|nr:hypothetical protein [Candidatus Woesearchaeota archaeon]